MALATATVKIMSLRPRIRRYQLRGLVHGKFCTTGRLDNSVKTRGDFGHVVDYWYVNYGQAGNR
mgnify:FL=1